MGLELLFKPILDPGIKEIRLYFLEYYYQMIEYTF